LPVLAAPINKRGGDIMKDFTKITSELIEKSYLENKDLPLCNKVKINIEGNLNDYAYMFDECLVDCESPIEQLLAVEMQDIKLHNFDIFTNGEIDVINIQNQAIVEAGNKIYRVDFLIGVVYNFKNRDKYREMLFAVECDGHDYHEKTKQQIIYNNQRERDLKASGYEIIRFSGSEICKSPHNCVIEIAKIIYSHLDRR